MGTIARLNTAKKKLAQAEQAMPGAYQNNYTDSINQKLGQLADASLTGSTGVDTDALNAAYQQYRANSVANAQNGAAAAAGTANTLAGGYGADWAKTAANQAAGEQIAGVDNSLSSLRADALQNWKQKMSDTASVLDDLLGQQSLERSEYDGSVSNAQNWRDYLSGRVDTARQENSDFWNNVWTGIKGVGSAVWNGYQNYEKYGQQKLQIQAQGYQMAQDAFNSGNPEQARQIMDMYGLDSTQVDKWTESYTTRQNKVSGLTQALSFAKAGSMDAAREALRQYGLDETILDTWQGMTDVEKDQMDAALNAMNASANGNDSAKNTILRLAGLDTNAVDDFSTVAGRQNSSNLAYQQALLGMQQRHEKRWERYHQQERRLYDQPAAADGKQIFQHEGHRAPVRLLQADPDQCGMDQGRHRHQGQYPERGGRNRSGKGGNHDQQAAGSDHQNAVEHQRHGGRRGGGVGEHGQPERRQLQYGAARSTADGKQWL